MMKKRIVVATREPARVNRLLSVLAEWLEINIIIKDFGVDSQDAFAAEKNQSVGRNGESELKVLARTAKHHLRCDKRPRFLKRSLCSM
jgi:hypothetical protein